MVSGKVRARWSGRPEPARVRLICLRSSSRGPLCPQNVNAPPKMAGRSAVSSHLNSAAEPPTGRSRGCPADLALLQCSILLEHERSDSYIVRRSNAVSHRDVCFLGRFLPKLGGALAPPFFCVTSTPGGGAIQRKTAWAAARRRHCDAPVNSNAKHALSGSRARCARCRPAAADRRWASGDPRPVAKVRFKPALSSRPSVPMVGLLRGETYRLGPIRTSCSMTRT